MRAMQVPPARRVRTTRPPRTPRVVLAVVFAAMLSAAGCAGESAPEVPQGADGTADPVLVEGRDIFQANCSRCHGGAGGGGAGPSLKGPWTPDRSPDLETMLTVVHDGRGAMPRFGSSLSEQEIEAVVRYVREVL